MMVNEKHLLTNAVQLNSPNCDARPDEADINLIVIHCISLPLGEYGTGIPKQLFVNGIDVKRYPQLTALSDVRVSAHLLIERDGSITQFVPFNRRAWHAGVSKWQGRSQCNDFTIGIELEGTDESAFEESQYIALSKTLVALFAKYRNIARGNVVGHQEIARTRKRDPGPRFNWQKLYEMTLTELNARHPRLRRI